MAISAVSYELQGLQSLNKFLQNFTFLLQKVIFKILLTAIVSLSFCAHRLKNTVLIFC